MDRKVLLPPPPPPDQSMRGADSWRLRLSSAQPGVSSLIHPLLRPLLWEQLSEAAVKQDGAHPGQGFTIKHRRQPLWTNHQKHESFKLVKVGNLMSRGMSQNVGQASRRMYE